ncbi:hypothetical protein ACJ41O_015138 [Fusarium nematophilum]
MAQFPPGVLEAFGIKTPPVSIDGGRGLCFQAGDTILKPSDDDDEAEWVASLSESITALEPTAYRTPSPIRSQNGYVYKGWTAWTFLPGNSAMEPDFEAILTVGRAFHADLARLSLEKPGFLAKRRNRFAEADLVAWEEKTLDQVPDVKSEILSLLQPVLDQLLHLRKALPLDLKNQLIHADLTGNVLFDPDAPPGIIDMTPYWRPAAYAEAIVVADGLAWHGRGPELVELYGTDEVRWQLLVRALYWRCLTFAIDSDVEWVRENLPRTDYGRCVGIMKGFIER